MTLTFSPPAEVATSVNDFGPSACALDASTVLLMYITSGTPYHTKAVVVTVAGTIPTAHSPITVDTNWVSGPVVLGVSRLDSTHAIATYLNAPNGDLMVVALSVSGNTVSAGTPVLIATNANWEYAGYGPVTFDSSHALISYVDYTTGHTQAIIATMSGTTITLGASFDCGHCGGTPFGFNQAPVVCALDSSRALLGNLSDANPNHDAEFYIVSYMGGILSRGTSAYIPGGTSHQYFPYVNPLPASIGATSIIIDAQSGATFNHVSAVALSISGTTITTGPLVPLTSAISPQPSAGYSIYLGATNLFLYAQSAWRAATVTQLPAFGDIDTKVAPTDPSQTMSGVGLTAASGVVFNDGETGFDIMASVFGLPPALRATPRTSRLHRVGSGP